jgi:glycerophosphoryl diester phosphodiesterase
VKRVAHRLNTEQIVRDALRSQVDMLEFDVLPERPDGTGELFLAHDFGDLAARGDAVLTLDQGLDLLCALDVDLDVDLKLPGYEDRVLAALRSRGFLDRVLVSTMEPESLVAVRAAEPAVRLGWSVPRIRRNPFRSPLTAVPAYVGLQWLRRAVPGRAAAAIARGEVDAIMANQLLVTPALVRAVRAAGGELYVWTVDDAARIERLRAMGVDAVITNRPELFAVTEEGVGA